MVISVAEAIVSYVIAALVSNEIQNTDTKASNFKVIKVLKVMKFIKVLRTVRTLRTIRMLRFSKTLVPMVMKWISGKIYAKMSFGYDVGRGFIKARFSLFFKVVHHVIRLEDTETKEYRSIIVLVINTGVLLPVKSGNLLIC